MPREAVARAAARLDEALSIKRAHRERRKLEKALERAVASAFRRQGAALQRELSRVKASWPVPVSEARRASWLAELDEAASPKWPAWEAAFRRAAAATLRVFVGPIDRATVTGLLHGAKAVIAGATAVVAFDQRNPAAEAWLEGRAAKQVALVNDTTRERIGAVVTKGLREGRSYDEVAKTISGQFKEFAAGKPQAHIDSRAHLVAITEVGEAYCEGNIQGAQALEAAGIPMEKSWDDVGDSRVSAGCRANRDAGWIALDKLFPSGHARPLRFPGCRCDLLVRPKED